MARSGGSVAVVGAGFCGTLVAVHLLHRGAHVLLVERGGDFGPGRAYGTANPAHLLNVPAGRMGAFPGRETGFLDWLRDRPGFAGVAPGDFVPRREYGAYLRQLLDGATGPGRLTRVVGDATVLAEADNSVLLTIDGRPPIRADAVVLAIGNFAPLPPSGVDPACLPARAYAPDPWAADALEGLAPGAPVLLVGSGLTMADAVLSLLDARHDGPIHVLSRHGLLPRPHLPGAPILPPPAGLPRRLVPLLQHVHRQAREGTAPWQSVVDQLRPSLAGLWCGATEADQRRFLRHLRALWDVHRHRLPPSTAGRIEDARSAGHVVVRAGRIRSARPVPGGRVHVDIQERGGGACALEVARIVNCTGPATDYARIPDPLVRCLLDTGLARPDPLRLGLDVTEALALRRADGTPSSRVFALGPLLRARFWEMTSVPDLRNQAACLADSLAGCLAA